MNKLVKKQKHLKTKAESTSPAVHETLVQLDAQRLRLSQEIGQAAALKSEYMDSINSKRSDEKRIAELETELEKWKPKPKVSEVVKWKPHFTATTTQNQSLNHKNPSFVNKMKPR